MTVPAIVPDDTSRARRADPVTSHAAADSITADDREASEREVLEILADAGGPITADAVEQVHEVRTWQGKTPRRWAGSRLRTAIKQLADDGRVVEAGEGKTRSGRRARTWRVNEERSS